MADGRIGNPVSGYQVRLEHHFQTFKTFFTRCQNSAEKQALVVWYLSTGARSGLQTDSLENLLCTCNEFSEILESIAPENKIVGRYPPEFRSGETVKVIVNAKNVIAHTGPIICHDWDHRHGEWRYLISECGKKIGKRYLAGDLECAKPD